MASGTAPVASESKPTITLKRGVVGLVGAATMGAIMMSPALGPLRELGPARARTWGSSGPYCSSSAC